MEGSITDPEGPIERKVQLTGGSSFTVALLAMAGVFETSVWVPHP